MRPGDTARRGNRPAGRDRGGPQTDGTQRQPDAVRIRLPALFADRIDGDSTVEVTATTVETALRALTDEHPALATLVWTAGGALNPVMVLFLNNRQLPRGDIEGHPAAGRRDRDHPGDRGRLALGLQVGRLVRIVAAAVAMALVWQTPVAGQERAGRQAVSTAERSALRVWDAAIDRQLRTGDLSTTRTRLNTLLPGRRSERLAQYYQGIPVHGASLNRQTDQGVTTSVFGTLFTGIDLDPTPDLSIAAARAIFADLAGAAFALTDTPALWVLPRDDDRYTLTYRGTLSSLRTVFIDAGSGEVLFEHRNLRDQSSIGLGTGLLGDLKKMATQPVGGAFLTRDAVRPAELRTLDMAFDPDRFFDRLLGVFFGDAPAGDQDLAADADNRWEGWRRRRHTRRPRLDP